jgi:HEAT repeat protein
MKRVLVTLLVTGAVAIATGSTNLTPKAQNALTAIDTVPTKEQITGAFEGTDQQALQNLHDIVTDPDPLADTGIRLRAIHALAKYCTASPCADNDLAHQSVASVLQTMRLATSGSDVLLLRASIETLGTMRVANDVTSLTPLLDHPSRDIRAATARALRDLCNTQAITPLRTRYSSELTDQVKLAISEALRILGQCSANQ